MDQAEGRLRRTAGPGSSRAAPLRPGPAAAAAPPPPRGRIRSKLPELRAGPEAAASRCPATSFLLPSLEDSEDSRGSGRS